MFARRESVTVVTAADGSATAYIGTGAPLTGRVVSIRYVKSNYTDGVDFTITAEATGETLWTESDVNASKTCLPRAATHSTAGVAATYDGTRAVLDAPVIVNDRIKIVIASGGNATSGTFHAIVE
jgi:hypothetical protein